MKILLFLLVVTVTLYNNVHSKETCDNLGTHYYDQRGCTANYEMGNSCPSYYTCKNPPTKKGVCTFWNVELEDGEEINNSCENYLCSVGNQKELGSLIVYPTNCYMHWPRTKNCTGKLYSLNSCCGSGENCETKSRFCFKDGKYHNTDEVFLRKNKCEKCICAKDLTDDSYKVFCEPLICNSISWQPEKIAKNCAPVYSKNGTPCCPLSYICDKDVVGDSGETLQEDVEGKRCLFAGKFYSKGSEFAVATSTGDVKCKCEIPPNPICRI